VWDKSEWIQISIVTACAQLSSQVMTMTVQNCWKNCRHLGKTGCIISKYLLIVFYLNSLGLRS
jgi:hypothetical protein